ncbi:MAG TPA: hypothetical protein DCX27_02965 [Balneola sp.]|nr:hypothetical protein [Balneola sp.]|tara:strand:- start:748 stop:1005 length:258 start_codon:yes stop_codon:yes gene_type:complete
MGKETSQGIHSTVSKSICKAMRRDYMSSGDRFMNQMKALAQGKDVVFTIENPNKEETNKRFIRQKVSGKNYLNSRKGTFIMKEVQ